MELKRRSFLGLLGALVAAPAIIKTPGLLMPVKAQPIRLATADEVKAFDPQAAFNQQQSEQLARYQDRTDTWGRGSHHAELRLSGLTPHGHAATALQIVPGSLQFVERADGYLHSVKYRSHILGAAQEVFPRNEFWKLS